MIMVKNINYILFITTRMLRKNLQNFAVKNYSTTVKPISEIPSPKGLPLVGTLFSLIAAGGGENLHKYIDNRHQQLGIIFQEKLGPISSIFLNDAQEIRKVFASEGRYPKHVLPECWLLYNEVKCYKRGLYFMDGEEWYKYRKLLNDIMLKSDFFESAKKNVLFLENIFETWSRNSENGEVVDLENQLYNLSLMFTMSFIFGSLFHKNMDLFLLNVHKLAPRVKEIFEWSVKLSVLPATFAMKLNLKIWKNFVATVDESIKITSNLVNDMLPYNGDGILHFLLKESVPLDVVHRIIVDFILAAGDTNAYTTLWTLYLLGKHKDIQDQLYVAVKRESDPRQTDLLKNILKESMRLYPVAPFVARYLPHEIEIASYLIPANHLISMSMFNCSRNEKYFPDGNEFKPNRWSRLENGRYAGVVDPYATLPFAMGARSCIGRNLSKAQLYTIIHRIISLYELDVRNEVNVKLNLITVPSQPVKLVLKTR